MKTLITIALAASTLAVGAPAMAQSFYFDRTSALDQRIDDGVRDGSLSMSQARMLRGDLRDVERLRNRYEDDGMAGWERRDLNQRLDQLSDRITDERDGGAF